MVDASKLAALAFLLIGISFLITGVFLIYTMIKITGLLEMISGFASMVPGYETPDYSLFILAGWGFAVLQTVAGLMSLIAGISVLLIKEE